MKKLVIYIGLGMLLTGFFYAPCISIHEIGDKVFTKYDRKLLWDFESHYGKYDKLDVTPWIVQIIIPSAVIAFGVFGMREKRDSNKSE